MDNKANRTQFKQVAMELYMTPKRIKYIHYLHEVKMINVYDRRKPVIFALDLHL